MDVYKDTSRFFQFVSPINVIQVNLEMERNPWIQFLVLFFGAWEELQGLLLKAKHKKKKKKRANRFIKIYK